MTIGFVPSLRHTHLQNTAPADELLVVTQTIAKISTTAKFRHQSVTKL